MSDRTWIESKLPVLTSAMGALRMAGQPGRDRGNIPESYVESPGIHPRRPVLESSLIPLLAAGLGALAGALLAWLFARGRIAAARAVAAAETEALRAPLEERIRGLEEKVARLAPLEPELEDARRDVAEQSRIREGLITQIQALQQRLEETRSARDRAEADVRQLRLDQTAQATRVRELETRLEESARAHAENEARLKSLVAETEKRFTEAFQNLGSRILEEKTARFTETNRTRLDELLTPFRERLEQLQKKVEETHIEEVKGQSSLKTELERLIKLNQQVSTEARELTQALKGDNKAQGNWGEMLLEKALELSGLTAGTHYVVQDSQRNDDGRRLQPDVVIKLPDDRHLVIDSKVSLLAYERYANATSDEARAAALAEHLASLRQHVKGLGQKNYPSLYGLAAVDFVLLFVPVEPALLLALREDPSLYEESLRKDVVLVSPTNLLATLRVVNHVWRLERQNRNVEQIGKLGGLLYDQFVSFVAELEKVRKAVGNAGESVDEALRQLQSGGGGKNLIARAERLRLLGVKATKRLPASLSELAEEEPADTQALLEAAEAGTDAEEPASTAAGEANRTH
jgi:DNA recombination protein RmuC